MAVFEAVLLLLLASVILSAIARKLSAPYPALLAIAGAGLALAPFAPPFRLDPRLVLALFVAPVLLDAAYDASPRDLRDNWIPVTSLVLVAVGLTTAAVAFVAKTLAPDLPWAAAVALGAVVAPPDAAAATAVLRQLSPPYRVQVILEGESLLNDASALLIYRLAVGAAMGDGEMSAAAVAPAFFLSVVGSIAFGLACARILPLAMRRIIDAPSAIILQFVSTFGVWLAAERLQLSPILSIVVYAIAVARHAPALTPARMRVPSYAVWETVVLVLNAMAFMMIGLQLRPILTAAPPAERREWFLFAGAVLATVILVRFAWVMVHTAAVRSRNARISANQGRSARLPAWQGGIIISWAGMRGIVTLAAALALPEGFPRRDLLLLTAFVVTFGTLVLQGLTLRPLLFWLNLRDDRPVEREIRRARAELAATALAAIEGEEGPEAEMLRREFVAKRDIAFTTEEGDGQTVSPLQMLRRRIIDRSRNRLLELRRDQLIGDDAFHRLEEELDYADLATPEAG